MPLRPCICQPPFYNRNIDHMYDRILHDQLRFPEYVPPVAREWLQVRLC